MHQHQRLTFPLLSLREGAGNPETTVVLLIEGFVGVSLALFIPSVCSYSHKPQWFQTSAPEIWNYKV